MGDADDFLWSIGRIACALIYHWPGSEFRDARGHEIRQNGKPGKVCTGTERKDRDLAENRELNSTHNRSVTWIPGNITVYRNLVHHFTHCVCISTGSCDWHNSKKAEANGRNSCCPCDELPDAYLTVDKEMDFNVYILNSLAVIIIILMVVKPF
jgi:hypothetical protein